MKTEALSAYTFVSIGENCLCQEVIRRHELNTAVGPFSWARGNIDYVIQLVQENFIDFLNPKFLIHREMWGKSPSTNIKYKCKPGIYERSVCNGFEFTHKDVIASEEAATNTARKTSRFQETVLKPGAPVILVYHYRYVPDTMCDVDYISKKINELRNLIAEQREGERLKVLLIRQEIISSDEDRHVSLSMDEGIYTAIFHTHTVWSGKDENVFGVVDDDLFTNLFSLLGKSLELENNKKNIGIAEATAA